MFLYTCGEVSFSRSRYEKNREAQPLTLPKKQMSTITAAKCFLVFLLEFASTVTSHSRQVNQDWLKLLARLHSHTQAHFLK